MQINFKALFGMNFLYNNYNDELKSIFNGRVQKISINAGFTCPNRDGTKGYGGCIFCNNQSFFPDYCMPNKSVVQQMQEGMNFFSRYKGQYYLAYFQAYTNTYASLDILKKIYEPVLEIDNVVGIVVATRPDCVDEKLLDYFEKLNRKCYVMIEYGVESTNDDTLKLINRGHDFNTSREAIIQTSLRGISTGAHLILGLPGENDCDIIEHAKKINELPLNMLKLHQLQIVEGTSLAKMWKENTIPNLHIYSQNEYIDVCIDFLSNLKPTIGLERFVSQSPSEMLLEPKWGLKNYEFVDKLKKEMQRRDCWQGKMIR